MVYFYELLENERVAAINHETLIKWRNVIPGMLAGGWSEDGVKRLFKEYKGLDELDKEIAIAECNLNDIHQKIRKFITGEI